MTYLTGRLSHNAIELDAAIDADRACLVHDACQWLPCGSHRAALVIPSALCGEADSALEFFSAKDEVLV